MSRRERRFWPDTVLGQILLLVIVASLLMVVVGAASFQVAKKVFEANPTVMNSHLVSVAVAKLNETPAEARAATIAELKKDIPLLEIELLGEDALEKVNMLEDGARHGPFVVGETALGMRFVHAISPDERDGPPLLYIRLKDGALIAVEWGLRPPPPTVFGLPYYLLFGFLVLTICGLMIWAVYSIVRPVSNLAAAARSFGQSSANPVPIAETGPREIRDAAEAFNRMQLSIKEFLERRTRMLAAVSHDLRTPLTRLRLRLDLLDEGDIRNRCLSDIDIMERQIDTALTFLRDGESSEPSLRIDVPSLLRSICDQYDDLGRTVKLSHEGSLAVIARTSELERAIANLIDNAIQYASDAEIRAARDGDQVLIDVVDRGPGIAASDRSRLLEPFERGDCARRVGADTGFGLGLAISKAIIEAGSGTLQLTETPGGGLTVRLRFPAC